MLVGRRPTERGLAIRARVAAVGRRAGGRGADRSRRRRARRSERACPRRPPAGPGSSVAGHPLALELAVEALARQADLDLPDGPPADVVEELFEVLLDDLDPAERRTVQTASLLRRITRPLLAAVVDGTGPGRRMRPGGRCASCRSPSTTRIGLELDPLARNVIAGGLEIREPEFVARVRRRAAEVALRDAAGGRSWDATADLLYLVQNHVIRNSYLPPGDQQHPVEQAVTDDRAAILAITEQHDGPEGAAAIARLVGVARRWRRRRTRARRRGHRVQCGRPALRTGHPAGRSGPGRRGGAGRRSAPAAAAGRRGADAPSGAGPAARRGAVTRTGLDGGGPQAAVPGTAPPAGQGVLGERRLGSGGTGDAARWGSAGSAARSGWAVSGFVVCALDFGPGSVDGWLARHVMVESGADQAADRAG